MSVPANTCWVACGHTDAEERRAETLPPCRRATSSPPTAPRNGRCRPWQPRGRLAGGLSEEAPGCPVQNKIQVQGSTAAEKHAKKDALTLLEHPGHVICYTVHFHLSPRYLR